MEVVSEYIFVAPGYDYDKINAGIQGDATTFRMFIKYKLKGAQKINNTKHFVWL